MKPAFPLTFTDNKVKVEAEDYHVRANNNSGTVTDDESASGGKYVAGLTLTSTSWGSTTVGQLDYYVKAANALRVKVSVHAKSNKTEAANAVEVWVDGAKVGDLAYADAYADAETNAFDLAFGKHQVSLKGVNGVTADVDYIEFVNIPANA